jgi:predicted porin
MRRYALLLLLTNAYLLSYQDLDIDGVDDSIDLCPNTPFDETVDKRGCSKSQTPKNKSGIVTIKLGVDSQIQDSNKDKNINLYLNYEYNSWDITLSNSTTSSNIKSKNLNRDSNIYIAVGKSLDIKNSNIKVSIGDIIKDKNSIENREYKNNKEKRGASIQYDDFNRRYKNRKNTPFISIDVAYILNEKQNILLYYMQPVMENSKILISAGTDYLLTQKLYSSIYYTHIDLNNKKIENKDIKNIDISLEYQIRDGLFSSIEYSHGLNSISANTISIDIGFSF